MIDSPEAYQPESTSSYHFSAIYDAQNPASSEGVQLEFGVGGNEAVILRPLYDASPIKRVVVFDSAKVQGELEHCVPIVLPFPSETDSDVGAESRQEEPLKGSSDHNSVKLTRNPNWQGQIAIFTLRQLGPNPPPTYLYPPGKLRRTSFDRNRFKR